jgi:hypothetical protein
LLCRSGLPAHHTHDHRASQADIFLHRLLLGLLVQGDQWPVAALLFASFRIPKQLFVAHTAFEKAQVPEREAIELI